MTDEDERETFIRESQSAGSVWDRYVVPRPHPAARSYRRSTSKPKLKRELLAGAIFLIVLFGGIGLAILLAER